MLKVRLEKFHEKIVCEDFILLYNFKNIYQLPIFEQAIINSTSSKFTSEKFALLQCFSALFLGTGQRPTITRARKSIALFQIRQGNLLGLKVTLRKGNLYNILNKLLIFVVPKLLSDWKGSNDTIFKYVKNTDNLSGIMLSNNVDQQNLLFQRNDLSYLQHDTLSNVSDVADDNIMQEKLSMPNEGQYVMRRYQKKLFKKSFTQIVDNNKFSVLRKINKKYTLLQILGNDKALQKRLVSQSMQNKSNFVISSKNATYFPEVSELLLFFNSVTGFSFDCSLSSPVFPKKTNRNCNKEKNQYISAFQYPVCKI